jgi:magnesium-protoporphyrin O-methyltransferase
MNTYLQTRCRVETYFDRTAAHTWARLTSDAPVGRIRATVRAGRERMRALLLSWLPDDLSGLRILDAGCGTGALAVEAARRGAHVTAIDLSPTLVALARERLPAIAGGGSVDFRSGDMLDAGLGSFDFVVAMDSLIHYEPADAVQALAALGARTRLGMLFTFAPANPALAAMHRIGKLFPRGDRSPAIVPVAEAALRRRLGTEAALHGWTVARSERVASGFYTSQAMQLARAD